MEEETEGRSHRAGMVALWMGVLLPPLITAAEMEVNFVLVRQACAAQRSVMLYSVIVVALIVTALSGLTSALIWRRRGAIWPSESADIVTRSRFISVLGMMSAAISFLLVLAHGIATLNFDPCQL
jgi:hypothetical protein